jgi:hypothetical protein
VIDITTAKCDKLALAVENDSHFPAWVSWVGPDANLGDVTYRTHFTGYQVANGVMLPAGYNTIQDWRNVAWNKLYVDKNVVNGTVEDLAAPAAVKAAPAPSTSLTIEALPIAKGIWYLRGGVGNSTLFEFDDHLTPSRPTAMSQRQGGDR